MPYKIILSVSLSLGYPQICHLLPEPFFMFLSGSGYLFQYQIAGIDPMDQIRNTRV
jgi:hypothetical protein